MTGAAGFIGSTLCARLLADGWAVRAVDCFTDYYDPAIKQRNLAGLASTAGFELVVADLRGAPLAPLLDDVDVVFHLAAQPGVRASWADGFALYDDHNIRATQRLLEGVRHCPGTRLVFASSSSVYGNPARVPTSETDPTRPFSPYGVTKLAGENLCRAYADNFDVSVVVLRYFTVYGPRQRPDMAIHRLVQSARTGTPFTLFGDGSQIRDFTFVDDVVAANIAAATAQVPSGTTINVAGGSSTSLIDLVDAVGQAVGSPVPIDWQPAQPGDVSRTGGAVDAAATLVGWTPKVSLIDGISSQVDWHRATLE